MGMNELYILHQIRGVCTMVTYIALLRGINVGGKNIIKMAELKRVFESIGLIEVQTYIQSGNVLFKSDDDEVSLRKVIESGIKSAFGLELTVVLRTIAELERVICNCPFSEGEVVEADLASETESLYVAFLTQAPLQEKIEKLNSYKSENDEYKVVGREVFLLFNNSIRNSKLASNLHRLDVSATVRNWKTVNKLLSLAKAME